MIRQPVSVIITGRSGSGKSELVEQFLKEKKLFYPPPKTIVYCYDRWQPRFDRMKKQSNVIFYKGLPPEEALVKWFKPHHHGILILDDLMEESGNDKRVLDLFTKDSHHRGITALYLTQDLFPRGKYSMPLFLPFASRAGVTRLAFVTCCFKSTLSNGVVCWNYFWHWLLALLGVSCWIYTLCPMIVFAYGVNTNVNKNLQKCQCRSN